MLERTNPTATKRHAARAFIVAAALVGLGASTSARADLKLCNTTASRIGVSIGYQDPKGGWTTEGWWNIGARTCETLYRGTLGPRFYVHAIDYDRGGEWAGKFAMCTGEKSFTIRGAEDCQRRGFRNTGFFQVDTQDSKDWTVHLTDPSEGGAKQK